MRDDTKNTASQIGRTAIGTYMVIWRGIVAYDKTGAVRKFQNEAEASAYLAKCEAAGMIVD